MGKNEQERSSRGGDEVFCRYTTGLPSRRDCSSNISSLLSERGVRLPSAELVYFWVSLIGARSGYSVMPLMLKLVEYAVVWQSLWPFRGW